MNISRLYARIGEVWAEQPLCRQFTLTSATIFLAGMLVTAVWTANRIEVGVTENTAAATAVYFESFVAPLVQNLAERDEIPADKLRMLDHLIADTPIGRRVVSFKIWRKGGTVVYATDPSLIGKQFPPSPKLQASWAGKIAAGFDSLEGEESANERSSGSPLLEIYAPIRKLESDQIIAIAEFYERADQLKQDINNAKLEGWLIIASIALCAVGALAGIMGRAVRTIERQIAALRALLAQNEELRGRVERSSQRASEINERFLRRLGGELHDGPAQHIGLALLRLDAFDRKPSAASIRKDGAVVALPQDVEIVRTALRDALKEIRNISAGLSLPELEKMSIGETLQAAVRDHTRRTNTAVETDIAAVHGVALQNIKTTAFRFVQEALNNATRHAGAVGQSVKAHQDQGGIVIEVRDRGTGFDLATLRKEGKLGLAGMRERVESIGGEFSVESTPGSGTCLKAKLPRALEAA